MGIIGVVLFALGIAVSIALHEAGHMAVARGFGMRVRRYFIGFGPTVWSVTRGHTEYGVAALPFGGFCDIAGMTAQDELAPDEAPLLILEIQNTGSEDCTLDVGTAQQSFVVASGGREIFNTAQCGPGEGAQGEQAQDEGASLEMDFDPGQTERAHLTWPRSDSAADCTEPADLEPGTYELTVSLGGITSETHEFTLAEA